MIEGRDIDDVGTRGYRRNCEYCQARWRSLTISKTLYEVGDALSNAGTDIIGLASDLKDFSDQLQVYHWIVEERDGRYLDEIYRITANIIGKCATVRTKVDKILKHSEVGAYWQGSNGFIRRRKS